MKTVMCRILKSLAWLLAALLLAPIVAFAAYDILEFQPHRAEIRQLIDQAAPDEKAPPVSLRLVVRAAHPGVEHALSASVERRLIDKLDARPSGGMLHWHLTNVLWWALVALHYSEQEQTTLFLSLSYMGSETPGFSRASPALVGVPLADVSVEQAARLMAVTWAGPNAVLANPERWQRLTDMFLARAKALSLQ